MTDDTEPYWVRYNQERQRREAQYRPPLAVAPAQSMKVFPLLTWSRRTEWWPRDGERYGFTTTGDDDWPAVHGYEIREVRETANYVNSTIEVIYQPYISDECPEVCAYLIMHNADTGHEECVTDDGFDTIDTARDAATAAFGALLERSPPVKNAADW